MDEVLEFCRRVLIDPELALEAAEAAREQGSGDRVAMLAAAGRACRERAGRIAPPPPGELTGNGEKPDLAEAVGHELAAASAQLAERHRETLALRELLGLSYEEIARVIGVEAAAVAPLLARARLRLRTALRGPGPAVDGACEDRDRSLRALARRQDGQPMSGEDEDWLLAHLAECRLCEGAHAAMLESAACYRGWR